MVQECLQIFLHLNRVVLDLSNSEDPQLAVAPSAVLLQQERQQHEQAAVMDNPPDVDVATNLLESR